MKHILLNLKRFDVPSTFGGVNRDIDIKNYGKTIVNAVKEDLKKYNKDEVEFTMFFQEAHIIGAVGASDDTEILNIGAQGVYFDDLAIGGNFGAFTSQRPASSVKAMGASSVLIGHCEERNALCNIMMHAGIDLFTARKLVNELLNKEVKKAKERGLKVVYCVGEMMEEQDEWQDVLKNQLDVGLKCVDFKDIVVAYEPIWSIGPGKTPADKTYITKIARYIKELKDGIDVVYGGGLKSDNAGMLASIDEIDGGLIALTRFSGEIGFYPEEYLDIIRLYLGGVHETF